MISYIVMAAGSSTRFKYPKALAAIENELCINVLLKKIISCPVREIIVVLGDHYNLIYPHIFKHNLIRIVYNNDYNFGQTSSAIIGLNETASSTFAYAIHPVDSPFIKTETIHQLVLDFHCNNADVIIPSYKNKKGHPPIFNKKIKERILKLDFATGINTVFNSTNCQIKIKETDDKGVIQSFNSTKELNQILIDRRKETI